MGRFYDTPYGKFPSVTTILGELVNKPLLVPWGIKCCVEYILSNVGRQVSRKKLEYICKKAKHAYKQVSKEATDIGTEVHDAVENWLKTGEDTAKELSTLDAIMSFEAFKRWWQEGDNKVLYVEEEIYSEDGFAGRLDLICKLDGIPALVDLKTSKGIYEDMGYQLAAYRHAWNQLYSNYVEVQKHGIIRVDKNSGEWEYRDFTEQYEKDLSIFYSYLNIYHQIHSNKEEKEEQDA